jgi:Tol biopolymer transport system component
VSEPKQEFTGFYSPDGRWIAYRSNSDGNWELYAVPANGGTPRRLTSTSGDEGTPVWTPDGRHLVYTLRQGKGEIWRAPVPPAPKP